jgi:hypothetical protein
MKLAVTHYVLMDICCSKFHPDWVKNAKIWATFHLCPEVKYACTSDTAFLNNFL